VSVVSFTKGLTFAGLWADFLVLGAFGIGFLLLGRLLLATQEH